MGMHRVVRIGGGDSFGSIRLTCSCLFQGTSLLFSGGVACGPAHYQLSWGDHGRPRAEATKSLPWHFPREAQDFQRKEGLHFFYLQNSMFVASFPLQCYVLAAWDFQLRDVTSGNVLVRCCRFCVSRKGGTGGSGWLHWKRENSMAVSGLCSR